jgi:hypothetical protein
MSCLQLASLLLLSSLLLLAFDINVICVRFSDLPNKELAVEVAKYVVLKVVTNEK